MTAENWSSQEKKQQFPEVVAAIERMVSQDQDMRTKVLDDPSAWIDGLDERNTEEVKRIVGTIGWPTVSKVGVVTSEAAWLLVQHADHDTAFQSHCLELMKLEPVGEVNPRNIAYLEDRIRVNTNRGQIYGTQFDEVRDEQGELVRYEPQPIEDPEHVDERRARMGLGSLELYTASITQTYYPHMLTDKQIALLEEHKKEE